MPTVRADFFLDPAARLTEQERALMTAMLDGLVASVADEVRGAAGARSAVNDDGTDLLQRLSSAGLLDIPDLVELLLRRAEQERLSAAMRQRGTPGQSNFLHMLAANADADVSAAAMAVILGRSRRRDRFDAPRVDPDDLPAEAAVSLVYAVAAALGAGPGGNQRALADAAAGVVARHDEGKRMEALAFALVHALDRAGGLGDDLLRSSLADGEVGIFAEILSRRAGVEVETAWNSIAAAGRDFACLLRMAAVPRQLAAEIAAALGQSGALGPAELIAAFDALSEDDVARTRDWLRLDRHYRNAASALGNDDGNAAD